MDLFENTAPSSRPSSSLKEMEPLATRMRPNSLAEMVGQEHVIGEGKMLRNLIERGAAGSLILYGPPSSGKTTLAHVISQTFAARFETINAVLDGVKELRAVVERAVQSNKIKPGKTILFVDEIHRWNKAQQDALLPHLESGILTLIGATTENPFYSLVNPLLSRCQLFELFPIRQEHIVEMMNRALSDKEKGLGKFPVSVAEDALQYLAQAASGDIRNALNALESAVLSNFDGKKAHINIDMEAAKQAFQSKRVRFDKTGDEHYHYASAFIKSMRGSDPDAALYWMCALLEGGEDPLFIFRRMLIFASEDVGLADPYALGVVHAAQESFNRVGMPEGMYFLSQAVLFLAISPKSNSTSAIFEVVRHIKKEGIGEVPVYLKDSTANSLSSKFLGIENASKNYKYPHSHEKHWVDQAYLPDGMQSGWYEAGTEGREKQLMERLNQIKHLFSNKKD